MEIVKLLQAENLKLRRTPIVGIAVLAPAMAALLVGLVYAFSSQDKLAEVTWTSYTSGILQLWLLMLLPLYVSTLSALYINIEHEAHMWKLLFTQPVRRSSLLLAKLCIMLGLVMMSFVVLFVSLVTVAGLLHALHGNMPVLQHAAFGDTAGLLVQAYVASIGMVVLQILFAVQSRSIAAPIIIGVAGFMLASFARGYSLLEHIVPWSYPSGVYFASIKDVSSHASMPFLMGASLTIALVSALYIMFALVRRDIK
jgi:hypothetical protein